MKEATFRKIRDVVYDLSGITLGDNKQALVRARISKRMRYLGIESHEAYLNHILGDAGVTEIEHMLDAISTNTTNFYREPAHFDQMRSIIAGWQKQGLHQLRIWSAAGSTGEEPYTLAIETLEAINGGKTDVKILATDIAPSVLRVAMKGEYQENKLTPIPKHLRSRYFSRRRIGDEYQYTVSDRLREIVLFRQFNLSQTPYPIRTGLDIIFCRNVMIYFDRPIRTRLVEEFHRLLKPGGYLFVGHAESITGLSKGFKCLKPSVYVRE